LTTDLLPVIAGAVPTRRDTAADYIRYALQRLKDNDVAGAREQMVRALGDLGIEIQGGQ